MVLEGATAAETDDIECELHATHANFSKGQDELLPCIEGLTAWLKAENEGNDLKGFVLVYLNVQGKKERAYGTNTLATKNWIDWKGGTCGHNIYGFNRNVVCPLEPGTYSLGVVEIKRPGE